MYNKKVHYSIEPFSAFCGEITTENLATTTLVRNVKCALCEATIIGILLQDCETERKEKNAKENLHMRYM